MIVSPLNGELDPNAIQDIIEINASKVIYLSTYPAGQARNIETLIQNGYRLTDLQPVDQFPQTNHVDNIAILALVR